jgi:hypothetical protein
MSEYLNVGRAFLYHHLFADEKDHRRHLNRVTCRLGKAFRNLASFGSRSAQVTGLMTIDEESSRT